MDYVLGCPPCPAPFAFSYARLPAGRATVTAAPDGLRLPGHTLCLLYAITSCPPFSLLLYFGFASA